MTINEAIIYAEEMAATDGNRKRQDNYNQIAEWLKDYKRMLQQEPMYCDRNICIKNEYSGIGCNECEVTRSQEPRDDAISIESAIHCLEQLVTDMPQLKLYAQKVADAMSNLPSVYPKPKTGHWIGVDEEPHEDYECDKCGYTISTYTANIEPHTEYKYCPNCGCRMVEPQENGE